MCSFAPPLFPLSAFHISSREPSHLFFSLFKPFSVRVRVSPVCPALSPLKIFLPALSLDSLSPTRIVMFLEFHGALATPQKCFFVFCFLSSASLCMGGLWGLVERFLLTALSPHSRSTCMGPAPKYPPTHFCLMPLHAMCGVLHPSLHPVFPMFTPLKHVLYLDLCDASCPLPRPPAQHHLFCLSLPHTW